MADPPSAVPENWPEVWRGLIESWNRGERERDYSFLHPEFSVHSTLADRDFDGPEGLLEWFAEIEEQFDRWAIEVDERVEVAANHCLMSGTIHFRGRESGIEMDVPMYWVFEFEEGLARRLLNIRDLDAAREAAGLGGDS